METVIPRFIDTPPNVFTIMCLIDVDECQNNLHQCGEGQLCNNLPGSYRCECQAGYQYDSFRRMCVGMFGIVHNATQNNTWIKIHKLELYAFCLDLPSGYSSCPPSLLSTCSAAPESPLCFPSAIFSAGSCSGHLADGDSCVLLLWLLHLFVILIILASAQMFSLSADSWSPCMQTRANRHAPVHSFAGQQQICSARLPTCGFTHGCKYSMNGM